MKLHLGAGGLVQRTWLQHVAIFAGLLLSMLVPGSLCAKKKFIMTPAEDLFIQVGGDLELNCTIQVEDPNSIYRINVYNLSISHGSKALPESLFTYHQAEATIQLIKRNITLEDKGSYLCFYDNSSYEAFRVLKKVNVGVPPGKPEKIYCISHNFLNMTCYVDLRKVDNHIPVKWTMQYRKARDINITVNCSEDATTTHLICGTLPTKYFRLYEQFNITVFGKNEQFQFETRQSVAVFTDSPIVKPGPVQSLAYKMMNESKHVEISWKLPYLLPCYIVALEYKITVESQGHWDVRTLLYKPKCTTSYQFMLDLIPHANYTITVESKPTDAQGDIYWSVGATVGFQTQTDVPRSSTILNAGSFYMLNCSSTMACLVLYWKNPPLIYRHGDIVGYQVEMHRRNAETTSPVAMALSHAGSRGGRRRRQYRQRREVLSQDQSQIISGYRVYEKLELQLERQEDYVVRMRTATKVGYSRDISEITISAWSVGVEIRARWVSVELDGDRALVSWQMDDDYCANITEVTYYWCSTEQDNALNTSYAKCKDDLDWFNTTVQGACENDTHHWVNITKYQSGIRFAVSIADNGKSGGMVWESFRFKNYNAVPGKPLYSIMSDQSNHTLLNVNILYGDYYISEGGRPDTFTVVYKAVQNKVESQVCPSDGHKLTYQVDFLNPILTVSGLQPGTLYLVCVGSSNSAGVGKYGEPQLITTIAPGSHGTSSSIAVAVAVATTVVGTIFLVVVIVLCCKFRKKMKKTYVIDDIIVATMDNMPVHRNGWEPEKQENENEINENDSGKGTSNSPSSSAEQVNSEEEEQTHEQTPILNRKLSGISRASSVSALSGYMKVGGNSDNMLLSDGVYPYEHYSLIHDDSYTSDGNECFVNIAADQSTFARTKKTNIYHDIPSDLLIRQQEVATDYVSNETPGNGKPTAGKPDTGNAGLETEPVLSHVTLEYVDEKMNNVNQQGTAYVPNDDTNNLALKLPRKEHDYQVVNPDPCDPGSVDGNKSSVYASEYSLVSMADVSVANNGICVIAHETDRSNHLSNILTASPQSDKKTYVDDLGCTLNMFEDGTDNQKINVKADHFEQVSKDMNVARVGLHFSEKMAENSTSDTPPRTVAVGESDMFSDDESDKFSSVVDDLLENTDVCPYQNPDTLSIGQGSISSEADTVSVTSSDTNGEDFETGHDGENLALVLEVCNQIMSKLKTSETDEDSHDKEIQRKELELKRKNVQYNPKNSDIGTQVPAVTVDFGGSKESINCNSGSSGQGVNSYVKAAVPYVSGPLQGSGCSVLNMSKSDSGSLDILRDGETLQQDGKGIADISDIIIDLRKREHLPENIHF